MSNAAEKKSSRWREMVFYDEELSIRHFLLKKIFSARPVGCAVIRFEMNVIRLGFAISEKYRGLGIL